MDKLDPQNPSESLAGDGSPSPAILSTEGLTKTFSGVAVVNAANVTFRAGEIHGLIGQNGAGKSSLMKMVSGIYKADAGHVRVDGEQVVFRTPRQARDRGVSVVAQELSLAPALSVAENILLGQQPSIAKMVNRRALHAQAKSLIERHDFDLDPDAIVSSLSSSAQQRVEILRALASKTRLIVLDEPTSSMSIDDSKRLYEIIRALAAAGTCVVLVSHFLEEILDVCDVVTVMRDGEVVVASTTTAGVTQADLVRHMVGEVEVNTGPVRSDIDRTGTPRFAVTKLSGNGYADVSLTVHPGEIVALVGLVGAGRSEILKGIFGADLPISGAVELDGERVSFRHPAQAVNAGVGMVTESRRHDGIFPVMTTTTNIALGQPAATSSAGIIKRGLTKIRTNDVAKTVNVQGAIDGPISALSGGNQQKALLGRWLVTPPRLYLVDEPTRGVDVVSIKQIQKLLCSLAADGMSVLMVTSEFDEALEVAHRIYTVRNGAIVNESDAHKTDKATLVAHAFGTDREMT